MPTYADEQKRRQADFRTTSDKIEQDARSPKDDKGKRHGHLLSVGQEESNFFPSLRANAQRFFAQRGIHWWRSTRSGDDMSVNGPTRNMASSQIACINFLMPFRGDKKSLTTLLRSIDGDIDDVAPLVYVPKEGATAVESYVEFEWTGICCTLEQALGQRRATYQRGANATSADALIVGVTRSGKRRAYVLEWKYTEAYPKAEDLSVGQSGETRKTTYERAFKESPSGIGASKMTSWFFEPTYQIMRLILLGDKMVREKEFGVDEAKVVVVSPKPNAGYRQAPAAAKLGASSIDEAVRRSLGTSARRRFAMVCPHDLAEALRAGRVDAAWSAYMSERYGW
jgi:hypothetical protein